MNEELKVRTADKSSFGISVELSHLYAKLEFFLELLDGIESFDSPENNTEVGHHTLQILRAPYTEKPENQKELRGYWEQFVEK
ncbi:hypothetical protein NMT30_003625 [Vibrio cholerae]|nr:hypothetical protein [Vibrio cholerae]